MPAKKPIAGASGSDEPRVATCTANERPRAFTSPTTLMAMRGLPASKIALSSSYSAKVLSGRGGTAIIVEDPRGGRTRCGRHHGRCDQYTCYSESKDAALHAFFAMRGHFRLRGVRMAACKTHT